MAKKNVTENTEVIEQPVVQSENIEQPETVDTGVQAGTEIVDATSPDAAGEPEQGKEELSVPAGTGSGEQEVTPEGAELDIESESNAAGEEGSGIEGEIVSEQKPDEVIGAGEAVEMTVIEEPETKRILRKRVANEVFYKHSLCKVLYFTSDMIPFFEKADAIRHSASLKENTVVTVNKD
jgi:hypothetical protein